MGISPDPEGRHTGPRPLRVGLLTERERTIVRLTLDGYRVNDIAEILHCSGKTVETHSASVLRLVDVAPGPHGRWLPMLRYAVEHDQELLPEWLRDRLI